MIAPANTVHPLRRARISREKLHGAFVSLASKGLTPDLRANAYGLGVAEVSTIAAEAGHTHALLSEGAESPSVLERASEGSTQWLQSDQPWLTFEADVVSLKREPEDTPVSYGYQYRTPRDTTLALVSVGYADGVPRTASFSAHMALRGDLHAIAGRIAMDQCVLDIGDAGCELGETIVVWGNEPRLEQWSHWSGRSPELLVSHLAARVVRVWE
jgi:alanine racemase